MRTAPRGGVTAGVVASAVGAFAGCGGGDFQPWWDQDKGAIAGSSGGGSPTHTGDGGVQVAEAGGVDGSPTKDAGPGGGDAESGPPAARIHTAFYVLMSRQAWSDILGSNSAKYINHTLLPMGAHAERFYSAPDQVSNSLPNAMWIEAGQDFGFTKNNTPLVSHTATKNHLVDQLEAAGIGWKAYVEGINAAECPIVDSYPYRAYHVPFLYFDDVVGNPASPAAQRCIQHVAQFKELASDLNTGAVPPYAFVVPDLCDDMHDDCNTGDPIKQGDDWLAANIPGILASKQYAAGGAVFVAWDFNPVGYQPVGFIALSPKARAGYASKTSFSTSSTLRSFQEIFGVGPLLGDAANATDVGELFTSFP